MLKEKKISGILYRMKSFFKSEKKKSFFIGLETRKLCQDKTSPLREMILKSFKEKKNYIGRNLDLHKWKVLEKEWIKVK